MSFNLGFKALAYPASNLSEPTLPCQCSVAFRCDSDANKATILLVATVPTAHAKQTFVLQYDADKLLSDAVSLSNGNNHVTRPQLDEILRDKDNKRSDIKTLALGVEQPCPLWCPDFRSFAHRPGSEPLFRQFVDLTKAATIHIVFDYKYLPKQHQAMFKAFSKAAKGLAGYPVEGFLTKLGLRKATWEVFGPVDAVGAPPAYDNSRKRSRPVSSTSPSQSPKRFAPQSPTESYTSEKTVPLSSATAEAFGRALREASPGFDYQAEAINAAVGRQLPAYLDKALPALLPDILQTLFTGAPSRSNLGTPHTSFDSSGKPPRKLPKLTPLGHALLPHLRTHLADQFQQYQTHQLKQFQKLLDSLWDSAEGTRAHETAEMIEEMEEHKTDMMLLKEDAIKDLSREVDAVFEKNKEQGWEWSDALSERLEGVFGEMCDRIDRMKRVRLKKIVAFEVRKYERRRKGVPRGVGRSLVRRNQKLLGRRREADELVWFDC
ncbi:hypothetical protein BU25DRAFT_454878 [Macroventuria anomochaeta]|uniref:Uncharacterized protein n=1 Tax=Macroventuria anomochaeta TaxID=301207 RepID=A0ACB6SB46_9PLEO|nr:uncharacterized protein BU25DRAFT_454878 [Macroventuria anomochaeta]KAF2631426.1 hypothetical protein BU25DRAFT_454878 [Macroventuria anomochaeta]